MRYARCCALVVVFGCVASCDRTATEARPADALRLQPRRARM